MTPEPLAAVVDPRDALRAGAPPVSAGARGNLLGVRELGASHLDMPIAPEAVWRIICYPRLR